MPKNAAEQFARLQGAFDWSRQRMMPFREQRLKALKIYLGRHYNGDNQLDRQPVNMLELAVRVYKRNLAARNPAVVINARNPELKPTAKRFELTVNKILREMDFSTTMQQLVFDALFSVGIAKVGITDGAEAELHGVLHDAGQAFVDTVDLDDFVVDMNARKWEAVQFIGNRYQLPYEQAMDSGMFKNKDAVKPSVSSAYNEGGDSRAAALSVMPGIGHGDTTARDIVELWDIFLPYDRKMYTFRTDDRGGIVMDKPLREVDWTGPEPGPFHVLALGEVAANLMPLPPIANLIDVSDAMNRSFRKLVRQQDRQKTITMVAAGADEDGNRIMQADDGDMIRVDRPEATREARYGGVDQGGLAFGIQLKDLFSYLAGNLDTMGGLSSSASTLGQEQIIRESSSQMIQDMQARVVKFAKCIVKSIGVWTWYDPVRTFDVEAPIGISGRTVNMQFAPEDRDEADFFEMELDIAPASMQDNSPAQRMDTMTKIVSQYLMPLAPVLQQQGLAIDVAAFTRMMSEMTNTAELRSLLVPTGAPPDPTNPDQATSVPPVTTRRYIRENIATGGTRSARDNVLSQVLAGGNVTPQQQQMMNEGQV